MEEVRIELLKHEELPKAVEVVAGAMSTSPLFMALFEGEEDRSRHHKDMLKIVLWR